MPFPPHQFIFTMARKQQPQRRRRPDVAELSQNCWNCAGHDFVSEHSERCGHAAQEVGGRIADMLA